MIKSDEIVAVGKFLKTHALKGELNMVLEIDPEYFEDNRPVILDYEGIWVPYYIESIRKKGSTSFLVKLEGVDSEEEASGFVNKEVFILKKDAEEWFEDEIMDRDSLIGFRIKESDSGEMIGTIVDIDDSTSNLLFIVDKDGETIYIPANDDFIIDFDEDNKEIIMNLPEGLVDLNTKD